MGRNINGIDHTNIILNGKYINDSILFRFSSPKVIPVPFASNLINIPKLRHFLIIDQQSNLCQRHIPRTSFNPKTGRIPYQIKISLESNGQFTNIIQPH